MKVAFFETYVLWPTHYETELELMMVHLQAGDDVSQLYCNSNLINCDQNPWKELQTCLNCNAIRKHGYKFLPAKIRSIPFLNLNSDQKQQIAALKKSFRDISELKELTLHNFDIGFAVASSVISNIRTADPDTVKNAAIIENYITAAAGVYFSVLNYIESEKPDRFYAFNGRLSHPKAVLRACEAAKVDCYIHERSGSVQKYVAIKNATPHNLTVARNNIELLWNEMDATKRVELSSAFFEKKYKSLNGSWYSFTKDQTDEIPENWDATKQNVLVFNSSEDEFASVGKEWYNPLYKNQLEALTFIIRDLPQIENTHVYLRVHPNLKKVDNEDKRALYNLKGENFTLIPAESSVSTYRTLAAADKVITFGSTMGIEATYMRKPSILAGISMYRELQCTYNPQSHQELMELIRKPLQPKPLEGALKAALYYSEFGIPYRFYTPDNMTEGHFAGKRLDKKLFPVQRILSYLLKSKLPFNLTNKLTDKYNAIVKSAYLP